MTSCDDEQRYGAPVSPGPRSTWGIARPHHVVDHLRDLLLVRIGGEAVAPPRLRGVVPERERPRARRVLDALARRGISIDAVAGELLVDGLARFAASADDLLRVLDQRRAAILGSTKAA
ncbi:Transaldolase [Minicystis rosea]|nr:Transaldolase [Minicystis rosea]